jgi:hypothetical protein
MDNTRLPKHALNYKPRGKRDCGRKDGKASMPEQAKRTNPWRKMMMMNNDIISAIHSLFELFKLVKMSLNINLWT